jgi:hypothetical protein
VRRIQSPLNLLEEGFAGRRKICNQLLQGIDEQEITHDLVGRAVQQQKKSRLPSPRFSRPFHVKIRPPSRFHSNPTDQLFFYSTRLVSVC